MWVGTSNKWVSVVQLPLLWRALSMAWCRRTPMIQAAHWSILTSPSHSSQLSYWVSHSVRLPQHHFHFRLCVMHSRVLAFACLAPNEKPGSASLVYVNLSVEVSLQIMPGPMMNAVAGVLFNVLFPDWLQTALLTVLLLFVINKTVRKGVKQWSQEQKAIEQRRKAEEAPHVRDFPKGPLFCGSMPRDGVAA